MRLRNIPAVVEAALFLTILVAGHAGGAQDAASQPGPSGYHLLKTIAVGGTEGWDYVTMDSASRRLYIGRDDHIDVVDVDAGAVVARLRACRTPTGW